MKTLKPTSKNVSYVLSHYLGIKNPQQLLKIARAAHKVPTGKFSPKLSVKDTASGSGNIRFNFSK